MSNILNEDFIYLVLSIVEEIPVGYVATYGQIASLVNRPKNARLIGKILGMSEFYGRYPCHRVVNYNGRIAPHFKEQKNLLLLEGVTFKDDVCVEMKKHKWNME